MMRAADTLNVGTYMRDYAFEATELSDILMCNLEIMH